jgi:hypothetical protein
MACFARVHRSHICEVIHDQKEPARRSQEWNHSLDGNQISGIRIFVLLDISSEIRALGTSKVKKGSMQWKFTPWVRPDSNL